MTPPLIDPAEIRIGIDGYNLALPRGTGVATYGRSLAHALSALGHPVDALYGLPIDQRASPLLREVEFFDLLQNERAGRMPKYPSIAWARMTLDTWLGTPAFSIPITSTVIPGSVAQLPPCDRVYNATNLFHRANRFFRAFGRFAKIRMPHPPAIMHWTYPIPVHAIGARNIYTIHDLVPVRLPYTTLDHKPTYLNLVSECLRCGDHIVTVSETSRADIMQAFPAVSPERITNTYQCVVPAVQRPLEQVQRMVRGAFDLEPGRYFLFFGSIEPKKNLGRLIEAYLSTELDLPLVIIGARSWKAEQELALLQHRPHGDRRIRQVEYVSPDVLSALVTAARAVVCPSLYEGFGLPLLEAMAAGTPVLASSGGALPEIAGDAALLVDPYDTGAITSALERLAGSDALCAEFAARGLTRAAEFSMDRYQTKLGKLYRTVMTAHRSS